MAKCRSCGSREGADAFGRCGTCGAPFDLADPSTSQPSPASPAPKARRIPVRLVAWLAILAIFGIAGYLEEPKRSDTGEIVDDGVITVYDLRIGDCGDWPTEKVTTEEDTYTVEELTVRPCTEPHDFEVYALQEHPAPRGETYPGDDALIEFGSEACYNSFAGYVGASYEESLDLDIDGFWPTEDGWDLAHNRTVICMLIPYQEGEKLTGSRHGSDA